MNYHLHVNGEDAKGSFEEFASMLPFSISDELRDTIRSTLADTGRFRSKKTQAGAYVEIAHTFH